MMQHEKRNGVSGQTIVTLLIAVVAAVLLFNQYQIWSMTTGGSVAKVVGGSTFTGSGGGKELKSLDLSGIKSTGHAVAAVFPVEDIKTADDAIRVMIPTGTPEYGEALGVSFDDPVNSLNRLHRQVYPQIKAEVQQDAALWQRYLALVTQPVGISCEFCCGIGPVGVDKSGNLRCGCSHNPAIQALTLWLMKNTEYSDGEILREAMRWKALWFPKNMIELGMTVAGGDTSALANLPGMVGGC
jgi:hypothetical protein